MKIILSILISMLSFSNQILLETWWIGNPFKRENKHLMLPSRNVSIGQTLYIIIELAYRQT